MEQKKKSYLQQNILLRRNLEIIRYADQMIAFWYGQSHGTRFVIEEFRKQGKKVTVYRQQP